MHLAELRMRSVGVEVDPPVVVHDHQSKKNGKSLVWVYHNNTYYFSMLLTSDRFDPALSCRADPVRYLILGFDTEYQRYVDQPERRLENEVLSFHTAASLQRVMVTQTVTIAGLAWCVHRDLRLMIG